jgi:hypothetical protein
LECSDLAALELAGPGPREGTTKILSSVNQPSCSRRTFDCTVKSVGGSTPAGSGWFSALPGQRTPNGPSHSITCDHDKEMRLTYPGLPTWAAYRPAFQAFSDGFPRVAADPDAPQSRDSILRGNRRYSEPPVARARGLSRHWSRDYWLLTTPIPTCRK